MGTGREAQWAARASNSASGVAKQRRVSAAVNGLRFLSGSGDNRSTRPGRPSFMLCRMVSAMDNPVCSAALRKSFSRPEGTAKGYVLVFMEETYRAGGCMATAHHAMRIILGRKEAAGEGADHNTRGRVCSTGQGRAFGGTPNAATGTVAIPPAREGARFRA
jgi:hypothetical protein